MVTKSLRFQEPRTESFVAAADLSLKKFFAVKLSANEREVVLAGAGEGIGILMNAPQLGEPAEVAMLGGGAAGVSGAAVAIGAELASDANGKLITAVATDIVLGIAIQDTAAIDIFFGMERVFYVK